MKSSDVPTEVFDEFMSQLDDYEVTLRAGFDEHFKMETSLFKPTPKRPIVIKPRQMESVQSPLDKHQQRVTLNSVRTGMKFMAKDKKEKQIVRAVKNGLIFYSDLADDAAMFNAGPQAFFSKVLKEWIPETEAAKLEGVFKAGSIDVEFYKVVTSSELKSLFRRFGGTLRGIVVLNPEALYVWNGSDATHQDFEKFVRKNDLDIFGTKNLRLAFILPQGEKIGDYMLIELFGEKYQDIPLIKKVISGWKKVGEADGSW